VASGTLAPWRDDLALLAASGHVVCKLSGLTTEAPPGWRPADLQPYLEVALDVFGPHRCMLGSDWPVCTVATTVEAWFDLVLQALSDLSAPERDAVLRGTAGSIYGVTTEALRA
jgi:L-fuconolactonase